MAEPIRAFAALALAAAVLGGCGNSSSNGSAQGTGTTAHDSQQQAPQPPQGPDPLALPARVPLTANGPADPAQRQVIVRWLQAVRAGQIAKAAGYWAVPALVQNGTPVLKLVSRAEVRAFNGALPCGAVLAEAGAARGGFTITTVRLTDRAGGACGGVGARVRTAIRVRGGRIVEWYALPDAAAAAPPADAQTV